MSIAPERILVLPEKPVLVAPTFGEALWFRRGLDDFLFESSCMSAIIAKGIGNRKCPARGDWAAFAIVGAVVATLIGKYIQAPEERLPLWAVDDMQHVLWDVLWFSVGANKDGLDRSVIAAVMGEFLPVSHNPGGPSRSYTRTGFDTSWYTYPDHSGTVANLMRSRLLAGCRTFNKLPPEARRSVAEIAKHIPPMLTVANREVRRDRGE